MGSYNGRCVLSGLPIQSDEKVYAIPVFYMSDKPKRIYSPIQDPVPVCLPIKGEYDDYGSLEHIEHLMSGRMNEENIIEFLGQKEMDFNFDGDDSSLSKFLDQVGTGKVTLTTRAPHTYEGGGVALLPHDFRLHLTLIRADIYDYLTKNSPCPLESYIWEASGKIDRFFSWLQEVVTIPEDPLEHLRVCTNRIMNPTSFAEGAEEYEVLLRIFQRDQHNGMFLDQWEPYQEYLFDLAEKDELVGNRVAKNLMKQLVSFQQLCYNMWELGLTFDPKPYAGQGVESIKFTNGFYEKILEIGKESQKEYEEYE